MNFGFKSLLIYMLFFSASVYAESIVKCKDASGKYVYSKTGEGCARDIGNIDAKESVKGFDKFKELSDHSKSDAQKEKTKKYADVCKFQYYIFDEQGEKLANAAKEECIANEGKNGSAYEKWRDYYYTQKSIRKDRN